MSPCNILISVIHTDDWQPIVDITRPSVIDYCAKHGYSYTYTNYSKKLKDFDKIRVLEEIMSQEYFDFIWALDADTLITNHNIKIEEFLNDINDLFLCKDINGINCGSFIIRCCDWMEWFLAWMLDLEGFGGMHCEQDAVNEFFDKLPTQAERHVKMLPQSTINSYMYELYPEHGIQTEENGQWIEDRSFVLHLPGVGFDKRIEILKNVKISR